MIRWVNILKGLGILFIVFGHSYVPDFMYQSFYYFHIPLFYFISGFLFNKSQPKLIPFLKSKTKTYMGNYYIYSSISTILIFLLYIKNDINHYQYLQSLLFGQIEYMANSNLWFLPSLYLTVIFGYLLFKIILNNIITLEKIILILLFLIILIYYSIGLKNSVFSITTVPVGLFFFVLGYCYKKFDYIDLSISRIFFLLLITIFIFYLSYHNGQAIDIGHNSINGSVVLMIINALLGIFILVFISKKIEKNKLLEYLGNISLYIFVLHQIFVPVINKIYLIMYLPNNWIITGVLKIIFSILVYELIIKSTRKRIVNEK